MSESSTQCSLDELPDELAPHLEGYEPSRPECPGREARLVHESGDGRMLVIRQPNGGRYEVDVVWPSFEGVVFSPSKSEKVKTTIGVSVSRGVPMLGTAITNRLLPGYHDHFEEKSRLCKSAAYASVERDVAIENLVDEFELQIAPAAFRDGGEKTIRRFGLKSVSFSDNKVQLSTMPIPCDLAEEIFELLRKRCPRI